MAALRAADVLDGTAAALQPAAQLSVTSTQSVMQTLCSLTCLSSYPHIFRQLLVPGSF